MPAPKNINATARVTEADIDMRFQTKEKGDPDWVAGDGQAETDRPRVDYYSVDARLPIEGSKDERGEFDLDRAGILNPGELIQLKSLHLKIHLALATDKGYPTS